MAQNHFVHTLFPIISFFPLYHISLISFVICFLNNPHDFAYQTSVSLLFTFFAYSKPYSIIKAQNISFSPWHDCTKKFFFLRQGRLLGGLSPTRFLIHIYDFYYNSIVMVYWG